MAVKNYELEQYSEETFESIKHINEYGQEYWLARELGRALQYADWRNFENAIFKAMDACKNSGVSLDDNFGEVTSFTKMNNGKPRKISDYALSRYACYLIVMNGDPSKSVIAVGQTYFAVKTRQQELIDNYDQLSISIHAPHGGSDSKNAQISGSNAYRYETKWPPIISPWQKRLRWRVSQISEITPSSRIKAIKDCMEDLA